MDVLPLDACVVVPLVVPLAPCGCCLTQTGGACANDLVEDIAVFIALRACDLVYTEACRVQ